MLKKLGRNKEKDSRNSGVKVCTAWADVWVDIFLFFCVGKSRWTIASWVKLQCHYVCLWPR